MICLDPDASQPEDLSRLVLVNILIVPNGDVHNKTDTVKSTPKASTWGEGGAANPRLEEKMNL